MNSFLMAALFCVVALSFIPCAQAAADDPKPASADNQPRKIYAHYMACYPVASAAPAWERAHDGPNVRHDGPAKLDRFGGQWRNWPLVPQNMEVSLEESMDLEIRRAMRAGIDGFVVDMANEQYWYRVIDAMFKVAEAKKYPFEISVVLDGVPDPVGQIKWLLDTHGKSPNLAGRDGKPFVAGYYSASRVLDIAAAALAKQDGMQGRTPADLVKSRELRTTPEGWQLIADAYREMDRRVGTPVYWHFSLDGLFQNVDPQYVKPEMIVQASEVFAKNGFAVGAFLGFPEEEAAATAVTGAGGEWAQPMWYQYENAFNGFNQETKGFETFRMCWERARKYNSTVIQFITWNDYTESTHLAPAYQTRYSILDLNAYFAQWWETQQQPRVDNDRIYLSYPAYVPGAKTYPYESREYSQKYAGVLEVLTILPEAAKVRLARRGIEYDAPAGLFARQFPAEAGSIEVEIVRGEKVSTHLRAPEPITDKPFREQTGMVCFSSEEQRQWKADFPETSPFFPADYGDDNGNGLPNWFEMYWFGKFLDYTTTTGVDPNADPDGDGRTNLQEYMDQTNPIIKDTKANPAVSTTAPATKAASH